MLLETETNIYRFRSSLTGTDLLQIEQVCKERTDTVPNFDPDQLVHQKIPVFCTN
jgi:hypothetical protein